MVFTGEIVDVFVSSPGDVITYRDDIMTIIQAWNQRNGRTRGIFFNGIRWEDFVAPDIASSGQEVITQQVGDEYDIYLGVMWARFGTPTELAESGTEEEFDQAVARHVAGEPIKVSFLFCTADIPQKDLDGIQYAKVQEFKKKAQHQGCLTRDFVDEASLINAVNLILDKFANSWLEGRGKFAPARTTIAIGSEGYGEGQGGEIKTLTDASDDGLLDVLDEFSSYNSEFIANSNEWGDRLHGVGTEAEKTTTKMAQLSALGRPDPVALRAVLAPMIATMEQFADWCENKIIEMEICIDRVSDASIKLMDLSRDFHEPTSEIEGAYRTLITLAEQIESTSLSITSFADSLENSPRLDKKLNKSSRKVVFLHRRLVEKYRIFRENMLLCADDLQARLLEG